MSTTAQQTDLRRKKMRGGLGRTLLTAFLLLAIGPLSAISVYAISQTRQASQRHEEEQRILLLESYRAQIVNAAQQMLLTVQGNESLYLWRFTEADELLDAPSPLSTWPTWKLGAAPQKSAWQVVEFEGENALWVTTPDGEGKWVATILPLETLLTTIDLSESELHLEQNITASGLETPVTRVPLSSNAVLSPQEEPDADRFHIHRVTLGNGLTLVMYSPIDNVSQGTPDSLAAALVGTALLVALGTTVTAAFVTRRLTRPLYELTQAAVKIARGDLSHRAQVQQDNELGILALAFNTMTDQLHDTLETLEERVGQRTEELRRANEEIASRAHQLEMGAEIGAKVSAVHDLHTLLIEGTTLIGDAFGYDEVAVWLSESSRYRVPQLTLRATRGEGVLTFPPEQHVTTSLAHRTFQTGEAAFSEDKQMLALPLRLANNVFGSLVLVSQSNHHLSPLSPPHLQTLVDTFAAAIENARASEMEREALAKLRQIERHRTAFLGEMSHELSTSLNSIIGFSQLMLKELEGPLTEMQRSDLTYINRNGTHLLSLLDGMLELVDNGHQNMPITSEN